MTVQEQQPASVCCPECDSDVVVKDGVRYIGDVSVQRYLCKRCFLRFSDPTKQIELSSIRLSTESSSRRTQLIRHGEYAEQKHPKNSQPLQCMLRNLQASTEMSQGNENTAVQQLTQIMEYQHYLERKGRKLLTIGQYGDRLAYYVRNNVNIEDPEAFKEFLSHQTQWSNRTKRIDTTIFDGFLRFRKIAWEKPEYKPEKKPFILPTETELLQIIAKAGRKLKPFLRILKETGMRFGECVALKWTDIDFERRLISIKTEKNSDPRYLPITQALNETLRNMHRKSDRVFPATKGAISSNYYQMRKKLAAELRNDRLLLIGLHDFRHWKLTDYAHQVRDPFAVQDFSGHVDMKSALLYVHLAKKFYREGTSEDFTVACAKTIEEASSLIAQGFEFVHEYTGVMLYRKRK